MAQVSQVLQQTERALRDGRVVTVGDRTMRYCRRNEEFTDEHGNHFQALANGVYLQMDVYSFEDGFKKSSGKTWAYLVPLDELDLLLSKELSAMQRQELDAISVQLAFAAGLASIRAEDAQRRRRQSTTTEQAIDWSPSI